jgi:Flp pilus assembly pilin Flp
MSDGWDGVGGRIKEKGMITRIGYRIMKLVAPVQGEEGQTLPEYGLIIALVSVAAIVALGLLAAGITGNMNFLANAMNAVTSGGS